MGAARGARVRAAASESWRRFMKAPRSRRFVSRVLDDRGRMCCRAELSAHSDVVGDGVAGGVLDRGDALERDGAGDGLDDLHGGVLKGCAGGAVQFGGADGVDEVFGACGVAAVTDEDLPGLERDIGDGPVLEVDEAGTDEEEEQDEGDHHVVVKTAALVGPEEVAAEEAGWITHVSALSLCLERFAA